MEEQVKKETNKKKGAWKIIEKILDWVVGIFVVFIAAIEIISLATSRSNYGVPSFFGLQISVVATDSMAYDASGKEVYPVGDGLIIKKPSFSSLAIGDDITFYGYYNDIGGTVTVHRIIAKETDASSSKTYFVCQGTNSYKHSTILNQVQKVYETESDSTYFTSYKNKTGNDKYGLDNKEVTAYGVYMGKVASSSKALGGFYTAMKQPWAVILMIFIPCLIIAGTSIADIIKLKKTPDEELEKEYGDQSKKKDNPDDPLAGLSEEEKKKLKQEMVEKMLKDQQEKGGK
ncbi:MAG: hypothetical protein LKJ88_05840 [Bacilli bacterium]|jgi:hypothetical protein|nr:hypothetical protein [Bacilli bacterium]